MKDSSDSPDIGSRAWWMASNQATGFDGSCTEGVVDTRSAQIGRPWMLLPIENFDDTMAG